MLIGAIALVPMFRGGFVTVIGNGSDAHLAVGTAQFLQHHHPNAVAPDEPVDRVPLVWRSKPPIYLAFGAVARVAEMEPYAVIATLQAMLLALGALGFWLLARELLGAGAWAAAAAMGLVGLNRIDALHGDAPVLQPDVGLHGAGLRDRARVVRRAKTLARRPAAVRVVSRRARVRLSAGDADPAHRGDRLLGLRAPPPGPLAAAPAAAAHKSNLLWIIPLFFLLLLPLQGVLEKVSVSTRVLAPGYSLVNWGGDLTGFFPERFFLGFDDAGFGVAGDAPAHRRPRARAARARRATSAGAWAGSSRSACSPRCTSARASTAGTSTSRRSRSPRRSASRRAAGLARLKWAWVSALALIFLVGATRDGAAQEIGSTFDQLPKSMLELKRVDAMLPPDTSVRLDMPADGRQLWAGIILSGQPLCSQQPVLETSYPHVPVSRKADYVLADDDWRKPFDAVGPPVLTLDRYVLYRMSADIPGPDRCSRKMTLTVKKLYAGGRRDVE